MANKSWFNLVKRLFIWETQSNQEKKGKRRKCIFGRMKTKRLPSITVPSPSKERTLGAAEEEQSNESLTVAIAIAAAAEASEAQIEVPKSNCKCQRKIDEFAAIKIQTAFRRYLARKALQALKGIVKLQAIIRGRAVRRQAMSTLKCLQSIVSIQSQVNARRFQMAEGRRTCHENEEKQGSRDKIIRRDTNSKRRWDGSFLLKKHADASYTSKEEAANKRERIKEYMFINHRKSAEPERRQLNGRWKYWLEQWVDAQVGKSKEFEDLESVFSSNSKAEEEYRGRQLKLRNLQKQSQVEGLDSPIYVPRRRFSHRKLCSLGEAISLSTSPVIPTYMAATESTKAKARLTSLPKLRPLSLDTCSESYSPCKNKVSLISSINTEHPSSVRMGKLSGHQQRSPSLNGLSVPIKSNWTTKNRSFNLDRQSTFR
ncbi:Protein IQ-DOMAIN like [Quillaja saponaria]|uniref:Protein IQ-DOMAIN like n=1 Tax=Quillaja saponaria TaxID=32244 RepID=A0AAD7QIV7_QUISA|nr:Protein IQ-DOMAIN like [Quillaja saponaria]